MKAKKNIKIKLLLLLLFSCRINRSPFTTDFRGGKHSNDKIKIKKVRGKLNSGRRKGVFSNDYVCNWKDLQSIFFYVFYRFIL